MPSRARQVAEASIRIDVNGQRLFRTTATPAAFGRLAAGRLAAEGLVSGAADVLAIEHEMRSEHSHVVRVSIDATRAGPGLEALRHREAHDGVLCLLTCLDAFADRQQGAPPPAAESVHPLLRALTAAEHAERDETGGMHGCAIVVNGELRHPIFDVSRHSAADKAIGAAVLAGERLGECGLVTTARISGELAAKAAVAGLAWIGGRSVATSLALAIADAAGLPIVTRAGSSEPMLHLPGGGT
jgi:FdhD protein